MDSTFWKERLVKAKALLLTYDTAIEKVLLTGQSYQLDTGQTRTLVTQGNLASVRAAREGLLNEIATLEARVCGGGTRVIPSF
jgi:hypothetical protein